MKQAQYEAYSASLEPLTDEQLVERTASQLELCRRDHKDDDARDALDALEAEATRRGKYALYRAGCDLADERQAEARRVNQGGTT